MCVLISSTTFISHSKKNWARYDRICILVFMSSNLYSCPILMKLEFSGQILEKWLHIKFHYYPSSESWVVPCGKTDGRTDMTRLIVAFSYFANAPKDCTFFFLKTPTLCYVQSFAKRLGIRRVSRHTLTLKECICVYEREREKTVWFVLRSVTLSNTEIIQPCFLVVYVTRKRGHDRKLKDVICKLVQCWGTRSAGLLRCMVA
jgi:hypothetical protein